MSECGEAGRADWRTWLESAEEAQRAATSPEACAEWMHQYGGRLIEALRVCAEAVEAGAKVNRTCDEAALGGRALQRVTAEYDRRLDEALRLLQGVAEA